MIPRIAGAQSAEQSGIREVKRPFDPNIMISEKELLDIAKALNRTFKARFIMKDTQEAI